MRAVELGSRRQRGRGVMLGPRLERLPERKAMGMDQLARLRRARAAAATAVARARGASADADSASGRSARRGLERQGGKALAQIRWPCRGAVGAVALGEEGALGRAASRPLGEDSARVAEETYVLAPGMPRRLFLLR